MADADFSFKSPTQMEELGSDLPHSAFDNTRFIADACNVDLSFDEVHLPVYEVPEREDGSTRSYDEYLRDLCEAGVAYRYPDGEPEGMRDRLEQELSTIANTGYSSYFLIVADFIQWAKDQGILVGPGRGSAAGSLVSFLLKITDLDPLRFGLIFERFLNPARLNMPDIDIDFEDDRRDAVLDYVGNQYGADHVAQICTFGTMAARASVRDTGRAMGYTYTFCDGISKLIPSGSSITEAIESVNELGSRYQSEEAVQTLLDNAQRLEGLARHTSTHACAVVITDRSLDHYTPVQVSESGGKTSIITQYEMHAIEELGLLKMDFLGLSNLSIIRDTLSMIGENHGDQIDLAKLPLSDENALNVFRNGYSVGIFQLEAAFITNATMELHPDSFEELIALVSLNRPGPMDLIPSFIARKHGREDVTYLHDDLQPVLNQTYGIMIYQEQLMQASQVMSGFSLQEADVLRKAVGKKKPELMEEQKQKIIQGAEENGHDAETAQALWKLIEPFANYGFNKSHAACYALIAYQTAYLKAYYPLEFLVSLMNNDAKNLERIALEITEARQWGIEIYSPDVNSGEAMFSGEQGHIRYGLACIKNVSEELGHAIVSERTENGPFDNLEDFLVRLGPQHLNRKNLEALITAGALDSLYARQPLLEHLQVVLDYVKAQKKTDGVPENQNALFASVSPERSSLEIPDSALSAAEQTHKNLEQERLYLGLFLSAHPFDEYEELFSQLEVPPIADNKKSKRTTNLAVGGILTSLKPITTKNGDHMAFAEVEDKGERAEVIIFPDVYGQKKNRLQDGACLLLKAKLSTKDGERKFLAQDIKTPAEEDPESLRDWIRRKPKQVGRSGAQDLNPATRENTTSEGSYTAEGEEIIGINIPVSPPVTASKLQAIKDVLTQAPQGSCPVYLTISGKNHDVRCVPTQAAVSYSPRLIEDIKSVLHAREGSSNYEEGHDNEFQSSPE
jgi:DNA polymerase-3 subunit alpha